MEKQLRWNDHKSKNIKFVRIILIAAELITLSVLAIVFSMTEFQEEDFVTFGIVGIFMLIFFALPHVILYFTVRPKETVFDLETKTIHWFDQKKEIRTLPFGNIEYVSYSEYSYTVKTKNGTRTVTVYTLLGHVGGESIPFIEDTNFSKLRFDGEIICKKLLIPLKTNDGTILQPGDLDLPIHKRKIPNHILETEIHFSKDSQLTIQKTNEWITLKSDYNLRIIHLVLFFVSVALSLIIHFAFGDLFGFSIAHWESIPPSLSQTIFFVVSFAVGFFPYLYGLYLQNRSREISISKTYLRFFGIQYKFSDWEDLLQIGNHLCLVNDEHLKRISLFYFCTNEDVANVRSWILKTIFENTGGDVSLSRFE